MSVSLENDEREIICSKHDIILEKCGEKNIFNVSFTITNKKINLHTLFDWNIFDLLSSLNPDIIENIKIEAIDDNQKSYIIVFRRFMADLGVAQKYLSFHVNKVEHSKNSLVFHSNTNAINNDHVFQQKHIEPILHDYAKLSIEYESPHKCFVSYNYHIDLQEDLPKSMKNIAGIMIKKLFWRFKVFIENR
tara:strand:+ start:88 stop:660 length:573 start_codon:yes stop_codon:yes gene_type:complete